MHLRSPRGEGNSASSRSGVSRGLVLYEGGDRLVLTSFSYALEKHAVKSREVQQLDFLKVRFFSSKGMSGFLSIFSSLSLFSIIVSLSARSYQSCDRYSSYTLEKADSNSLVFPCHRRSFPPAIAITSHGRIIGRARSIKPPIKNQRSVRNVSRALNALPWPRREKARERADSLSPSRRRARVRVHAFSTVLT